SFPDRLPARSVVPQSTKGNGRRSRIPKDNRPQELADCLPFIPARACGAGARRSLERRRTEGTQSLSRFLRTLERCRRGHPTSDRSKKSLREAEVSLTDDAEY